MALILLKKLGTRKINGNLESYGEFLCTFCKNKVYKKLSVGKICKSCGCDRIKHGETNTKLYNVWVGIKQRCNNSKNPSYKYYGGRGITICPEWTNDYTKFRDWALSNGYTEGLEIDRRNTDGNYEPSNCRWVTDKINKQNRRNPKINKQKREEIIIKYNSGYYTQKNLAEEYNVNQSLISYIININLIGGI